MGLDARQWRDVDAITASTKPTHWLRLAMMLATALLASLAVEGSKAFLWLAAGLAAEAVLWAATRKQRAGRSLSGTDRVQYLAAIVGLNIVWWSLVPVLWFDGHPASRIAACLLLFSMFIHAIFLVAQSRIMLAIVGGGPAALLLALLGLSGFEWRETVFLLGAAGVLIAYGFKAALVHANRSEQLQSARQAAEAATQAKSDFLSLTSHELRTPVAGMLGLARILRDELQDSEQHQRADLLVRTGDGLVTLLNDLLDFSKIEAGRIDLEDIPFDLGRKIDLIKSLWTETARAKGLELRCDVPANQSLAFLGDPGRLRQILMNLVSNAVKFTAQGTVTIAVSVDPPDADGEVVAHIAVTDTGPGLSAAQQARLFVAFQQADSSVARVYGGSGLGLTISRRLARLMGGDITVQSAPNQGATFTLSLPLKPTDSAETQSVAAEAVEAPALALRILLVDDNEANRLVGKVILEAAGCDIESVDGGKAALERLGQSSFDAVLLDLVMPDLSGEEVLRLIRQGQAGDPHGVVIALTADATDTTRRRLLHQGFDAVETKPIDAGRLLGSLQSCLEAAALRARLEGPAARPCESVAGEG